ncbi:hypothetical protein F5884DRAFT_756306 [Xylogone sp. PMI_703]|nr:hypothetical protein F5884DRAFT_756306 [Xylogone sp. PMI_703]
MTQVWWGDRGLSLASHCTPCGYYNTNSSASQVVPIHSAILPVYPSIGIHSNHMDMTKFDSEDNLGFVSVVGELRRWVKELKPIDLEDTTLASRVPCSGENAESPDANIHRDTAHYGSNMRANVIYGSSQTVHSGLTFSR